MVEKGSKPVPEFLYTSALFLGTLGAIEKLAIIGEEGVIAVEGQGEGDWAIELCDVEGGGGREEEGDAGEGEDVHFGF